MHWDETVALVVKSNFRFPRPYVANGRTPPTPPLQGPPREGPESGPKPSFRCGRGVRFAARSRFAVRSAKHMRETGQSERRTDVCAVAILACPNSCPLWPACRPGYGAGF